MPPINPHRPPRKSSNSPPPTAKSSTTSTYTLKACSQQKNTSPPSYAPGHPVYGTAAIDKPLSSGAERLIDVLDGMPDNGILHCQAWGGTNVLAEALAHVRSTRKQLDEEKFHKEIRIPHIASIHGWLQYQRATRNGISGNKDVGGADSTLVSQSYISTHFPHGPLGSLYPDIAFIITGDSPCFLHTMQNGLNGGPLDHPE